MPMSDSASSFGASTSASVSTCPSVPKTKEYMDSLVLPSQAKLEHIAQVQEEKEVEARRRARDEWRRRSASGASDGIHHAASTGHHKHERDEAAKVIQKTFRGYRARRELQGYSLNASTRWVTAVREAQFRQGIKPHATAASPSAADGDVLALEDPIDYRPASARQKWKKVSLVARRAGHDDSDSESDSDEGDLEGMTSEEKVAAKERRLKATAKRRQAARMLGLQYFLEMVDSKHRYGSNLRMYHEEWKKSDTKENFFYWLDYGEGRFIELDTCPRDRLEREQVRYLSREERQYYLVRVDAEGRLCWLLRKSVKKNTWIFVADTSFRLYVGIKDSGAFQHSSFLQGSRISAAGLIKIKKGRLSSLSPLSGHYRPPASSFRAFVKNLKEEGVDMSHVSISKSYTILVGLETYLKTRKKGKELVGKLMHGKDKLVAPEEVQRQEEEKKDKSESAEKERRVLEREREEAEKVKREMSKSDRVMEKIKGLPVHAK
ncbi:IQ domain-containing protein IQM3 [Metarhizium anisopliae]